MLVDAGLVLVHAFANNGEDRGAVIVDLFRVADGRIVEHWDAVQPIPEHAVHDHPVF